MIMTNIRIIAGIAFLSMSAVVTADPIVTLLPSQATVDTGQSFSIDVVAQDVGAFDAVLAFGFDVSVESGLTLESAVVAPEFFDDTALFPSTDVGGTALPGVMGGADILLATLFLSAGSLVGDFVVEIGTDPVDFGVSEGLLTLFGPTLSDISASTTISVVDPNPQISMPEPGTLALLSLGLLGLVRRRKRS